MRSNRFVLPFLIALLLLCLPQIALAVLPTVEPPSNLSVKSLDNDGQFPIRWWYSPTTDAQYELEESVDAGSSWTPVAEYVDTTTREVIRTNAAAGNHQFRVRAVKDGYDPSSWAYSGVCVVELTAQPARLLDLPATSDDGRVKLFWKRSFTTGATYVAEQQIDGGAWETVAEYTDPSINYFVKLNQPSGSYVFRLKAVKDGFADSAWVTTAPCVVTYAVCDAPTSLSAEYKANNGAVLLSWQASTEPDVKYKMEISSDGGSSWSVLYKTIKTSVLIPVAEGNAYQFRVRATKTDFGPSPYVVSSPVVVNAIAPPSNMYVKAADPDGQFPVQWWRSPTDGVTHELEESFNGGPWSAVSEYVDPTANSVTKTGAATGAYQFRIRAVKDGFTPSEWVYSTVCVVCSDADNDGYYADGDACGAQDCNDQDLSVYPGGIEVCADDVDNNCDGSVDEGCSVVFPEKVPDTGQTECFDADGNIISCIGSGQDAEYSINPMSFTNNGDGTVTDNVTGLMWQQNDDGLVLNHEAASYNCADRTLGGYGDWRLPTLRELVNIFKLDGYTVEFPGHAPTAILIDPDYFTTSRFTNYWTSDLFYDSGMARTTGDRSNIAADNRFRCVRSDSDDVTDQDDFIYVGSSPDPGSGS